MLLTKLVVTSNGKREESYFDSLAAGLRTVKALIKKNIKAVKIGKIIFSIREMDVRVTCVNFVRAVKGGFDTFQTADHSGAVAGIIDAIEAEDVKAAEERKAAIDAKNEAEKASKASQNA